MVLKDGESSVEIAVAGFDGDVIVVAGARCLGFAGETDTYVHLLAWGAFMRALVALERDRRGETVLEAMHTEDLRLRIFATDQAGHMAVEGHIGIRGVESALRLEFSPIAFDPTQLPALVAELGAVIPAA